MTKGVAARSATELIGLVAEGVSAKVGEHFFKTLVDRMRAAAGAEFAFIAEIADPGRARVIAASADKAVPPDFTYDLPGTPCERVLSDAAPCIYANDVQSLFPDDVLLVEMGAEGYVGTPLTDSAGEVIGLIDFLYRRPVAEVDFAVKLQRIFAARAGAELERLRAENRLRRSEARLAGILETAQEGIISIDGNQRITLFNHGAELAFGYAASEVLGQRIDVLLPQDSRERHSREVAEFQHGAALSRRMSERRSVRGLKKDGTEFIAEASIARAEIGGEVTMTAFVRDITHRRRLEEALLHAQKMESVGQLAGGLAHDLNNMLNVVIGNVEMAIDQASGDRQRVWLETAMHAAGKSATLVRHLLAFSRRQELSIQTVDLNEVAITMKSLLARTLGEQVEISLDLRSDRCLAAADLAQVESAIMNFAVNARDAMPKGGRLTLATEAVSVTQDNWPDVTPGRYAVVTVSDNGTGIPPEVLRRVTDPFFTTKEPGKGTGLGLSMAYGLAKQVGGDLKIESELGKGTTVRLFLPEADAATPPTPTPYWTSLRTGSEAVLLVEDQSEVRHVLATYLRRAGYAVIEAEHGAAALSRLKTGEHFDVLVTDIVMPGGISGRELAAEALKMRPDLKVVFVSGFEPESGLTTDGDEILVRKPMKFRELVDAVRAVLDRPGPSAAPLAHTPANG